MACQHVSVTTGQHHDMSALPGDNIIIAASHHICKALWNLWEAPSPEPAPQPAPEPHPEPAPELAPEQTPKLRCNHKSTGGMSTRWHLHLRTKWRSFLAHLLQRLAELRSSLILLFRVQVHVYNTDLSREIHSSDKRLHVQFVYWMPCMYKNCSSVHRSPPKKNRAPTAPAGNLPIRTIGLPIRRKLAS